MSQCSDPLASVSLERHTARPAFCFGAGHRTMVLSQCRTRQQGSLAQVYPWCLIPSVPTRCSPHPSLCSGWLPPTWWSPAKASV